MNRLIKFLANFSIISTIGTYPKAALAGSLTLLGAGLFGASILTTPTITPFVSANFNPNQSIGTTNNGLKPNGGTAGATQFPTTATNSTAFYFEMTVDPNLAYASGLQVPLVGLNLSNYTIPGQPNLTYQHILAGIQGTQWWLNPGPTGSVGGSAGAGSSYATGFYPFTVPTSVVNCTVRQPTGVWFGGSTSFQQVDPGLGCPVATPSLNAAAIAANIPGSGAQQATGAGSVATTCAVVNSEAVVTAHVAVAHGLAPGLTYTLAGFTPTGYNSTSYTALAGTTGTTLVGTTGAGSCPAAVSIEGTALSGTGASITFPALSATAPFTGSTGVTVKSGQHICGWLVEYGSDSVFPGAQSLEMVDDKGNAVPGSPALVTTPNQGTSNITGWTAASSAVLTVTALNSYTITGATYNGTTGFVTFPVSSNPGFVPGSEFTVSSIVTSPSSPNLFNQTYIAVAGTSSTQVVGSPLSGVGGIPQPFGTSPGTYSSGGSLVSNIVPGQTILSATPNPTYVLPYGASSTTGTGGIGTYQLSATQTAALGTSGSPVTIFAFSAFYYSAATSGNPAGGVATARTTGTFGDNIAIFGAGNAVVSGSLKTGWGGALGNIATLWGVLPSQSGGAPSTSDLASICTKTTDIQTYALSKGITVNSLYRLNDLGIFGDSGNATITGYITNSSGTNATLNVVSTPYGSLALATGTETADLTGAGLPVASPVTIPLTTSASSTYSISPNTTAALGSSGSPLTFAVGAFKPALPVQSNTVKGYIDTTLGVSTLHVTTLDDGTSHSGFASGTGTLGTSFTASISGNTLTVTVPSGTPPTNAVLGVGTMVCPPVSNPAAFTCANVTALGTGLGENGTYTIDGSPQTVTSQAMFGSNTLPGPATTLQWTASTGTPVVGMAVTDGGVSLTASPLLVTVVSGTTPNFVLTVAGNYYPSIAADATMQASLTTMIPGEYIQNSAITNPVKIVGYGSGAIGLAGNYTLSASPNAAGTVGTSGSPVVITGTTITDGGAIAPGPALTIKDQGPFITFPLTNVGAKTGTIALSGTYDTGTLGGTPSGIQVLVSNSANGPPLAGCTPCNWGALTATISGGKWSGTIAGIPGGGPYLVSVRATNGIGYATLPNSVKVGWVFALWGQGQADSIQTAQSGFYTPWFSGLWGYGAWNAAFGSGDQHYLSGPPITSNFVPGQAFGYAGDRFGIGIGAGIPFSEAFIAFDQELLNSTAVPATFISPTRDGVGVGLFTLGNAAQTQTIGTGDGTTLTWCSASKFCGHVDVGQPLLFNAASLTGAQFSGSVTGSTLTATTRQGGALEPGMVLGATGSPTLVNCLTNCLGNVGSSQPMNFSGSTWALSSSAASGATGNMRADPVGGAPWPNLNIQQSGAAVYGFGGFGTPLVKAGTFQITDNGTVVCQDTNTFAYNQTGGNCTGANVSSSFVNYQTGDYQVTFTTAPTSGHALTAVWTNIISTMSLSTAFDRPQGLDFFGDSTGPQSGADAALFNKTPGGVNGHIYSGEGTDHAYQLNSGGPTFVGYQFGGIGYSQMVSWLYGTKFPASIPGASSTVPFLTTGQWRVEGPVAFGFSSDIEDGSYDQWAEDAVTQSIITGHIIGTTLTLDGNTTGPMWEGEIVNCASPVASCSANGPLSGIYITKLLTGTWGTIGSTYSVAGTVINDTVSGQLYQNPVYYSGAGSAYFLGTLNDVTVQSQGLPGTVGRNPHTAAGFAGGRRATSRWAAMIYCHNGGSCDDPKVDRTKADATGCDAAAIAAPCFDIGTTFQSSHSATMVSASTTITVTGGISAHDRPFVVGQVLSCSGCTANRVITSLDVPPTQSTVTGAGEIGQTFHITASGTMGTSATETLTAGCSGTSGTGSNCIDIAISLNGSSVTAIDTCGVNNLNGNGPNYVVPDGTCQGNGIGEITRAFRIGTTQATYGANGIPLPTPGSVWDDGVDIANGSFTQSSAFTCNIVSATVVQCVKGPSYSGGAFSSVGLWPSSSIYISYGDVDIVSGRVASLLGYAGGQSFPFTGGGSGYSNQTVAASCSTIQSGGTAPRFDVWTSGGVVIDVVPSAATSGNLPVGLGVGSTCTVTPTGGTGFNSGGSITIPLAPTEGFGGIATYNTDSNTMGMFLYDNSGESGKPLNQFFTNGMGGYFEPGLPLRPFGNFQGEAVSG